MCFPLSMNKILISFCWVTILWSRVPKITVDTALENKTLLYFSNISHLNSTFISTVLWLMVMTTCISVAEQVYNLLWVSILVTSLYHLHSKTSLLSTYLKQLQTSLFNLMWEALNWRYHQNLSFSHKIKSQQFFLFTVY